MITGSQIRAARAFLDWTREELATKCGLTIDGIKKIETNPNQKPHQRTLEILCEAFADNGIEFTERGVRLRDDLIRILEGEDAYLHMLDDVYNTLHKTGGEVLWLCSSDQTPIKGEYEAEVRIREAGIRFRSLIEEGKTETTWPRNEYRQIPKRYFHHNLQIIYGKKTAQILEGGKRILIIENETLTTTTRHLFDLIWSLMKIPPKPEKDDGK